MPTQIALRSSSLVLIYCLLFSQIALAEIPPYPTLSDGPSDAAGRNVQPPTRLIVELSSPPLAAIYQEQLQAASINGQLDTNAATAQAYISELQAEQAAFISVMQAAVPGAAASTLINEANWQNKQPTRSSLMAFQWI